MVHMAKTNKAAGKMEFRSLEEGELRALHKLQNGECWEDLSQIFDIDIPWAPMTYEAFKAKVDEVRKEARHALFGLWLGKEFMGVAFFGAQWDPWSPYVQLLVLPEHRRKGCGTAAAERLLDRAFKDYHAHVVSAYVPSWDAGSLRFARRMGFKDVGRIRRAGVRGGEFYDGVYLDLLRREHISRGKKGGKA